MSLEESEDALKIKLMNILEEELSALKLKETSKCSENEYLNHNLSDESEEDMNIKEMFSVCDGETAGILNTSKNEVEYKTNEALSHPTETVPREILRQINYQHKESEFIQRKAFSPENAEKIMQKMCDNENDKMCMNNPETFTPPSDSLVDKIRQRTEFYFEDYNLFKNSFLLNHIQRNKKGLVSLKLIASMRKIKSLTKDARVIAYSIRKSKILEMNPENTKIRRIEPVPKIEDTSFGKTLMVFNLPSQNLSKVYLRELFSKYGIVVAAEIYDIHSHECNAYHQRCLYFHRKIVTEVYGIVEFEMYDQVVNALKAKEGHLLKENEMKAVPLMPQIYKKERRYLTFLDAVSPNQRQGYERVKPRDDSRPVKDEIPVSRDIVRNGRMNVSSYPNKRGYFRRPYGGRRPFMPTSGKNYSDSQIASDYNGTTSKKWGETRQLRANNTYNVDRLYSNLNRKKWLRESLQQGVP